MRKQIIEYTSPLDALIRTVKQLNIYEIKYQMNSKEFFAKYTQGETADDEDFVEWSGNYQHYLALHQDIVGAKHWPRQYLNPTSNLY